MTGTLPSKLVRIVIPFAVGGRSDANAWSKLFGPRGMTKAPVQRIRDDVAAVIRVAGVARWLEVAKVAGITPQ